MQSYPTYDRRFFASLVWSFNFSVARTASNKSDEKIFYGVGCREQSVLLVSTNSDENQNPFYRCFVIKCTSCELYRCRHSTTTPLIASRRPASRSACVSFRFVWRYIHLSYLLVDGGNATETDKSLNFAYVITWAHLFLMLFSRLSPFSCMPFMISLASLLL